MRGSVFCFALVVAGLQLGCGSESEDSGPTLPEGCDYWVETSPEVQDVLQTTLIEAAENTTVCVGEGTFSFTTEISSSVDGLTIRGMGAERTIFDFTNQDVGGNGLHITGDGVTLEDFEVRNPPGDGIRSEDVNGIVYRRLRVVWTTPASRENGAYGLYPVKSQNVLVEDCYVTGASDAGIYVGQSSGILVRRNEVTGNVAGIEIENSVDAEVVDNNVYGNTGGVLIFNLPELPMIDGRRAKVHGNQIRDNNLPNFAPPGAFVYNVPGGSGLIVLASDANQISDNIITGNDSAGVILTSYLDDVFGGFDAENFDRNTEGNFLSNNTYENNGRKPQGIILELGLSREGQCGGEGERNCYLNSDCDEGVECVGAEAAPDIIFDGCLGDVQDDSTRNCIKESANTRFSTPPGFGFCIDARNRNEGNLESSDLADFDCEHEELPGQSPMVSAE
ncbi:MAG: parallel beta-helix domain-containing protein [Bradymonadia bacterium]